MMGGMTRSLSVGLVALSTVLLSVLAGACKDDSTVDNDAPLPGPGPIGAGGGSAAGAGGASGSAGASGSGAGAGGTTGGAGGSMGGAAGSSGGATTSARFGNLTPGGAATDFCAKPMGAPAFIGPVLAAAGGAITYPKVTAALPIPLPAGMVEIKAIAGGDCTATGPTATAMITAGARYTVLKVGGAAGVAESVSILPETTAAKPGKVALRFVHAIHGSGAVDVGLADKATMKISPPPVFANVPFGGISAAAPSGAFPVDANGYADVSALPAPVAVGAAPAGMSSAVFVADVLIGPANAVLTAYGIGAAGDAANPIKALLCDDATGMCQQVP